MDTVNIEAINSASFVFSRLLSPWASLYSLSTAIYRAYVRDLVADAVVLYEFASDGSAPGVIQFAQTAANGSITYASNPIAADKLTLGSTVITFAAVGTVVTFTTGSPGVVNWTAHGLSAGQPVTFFSTGALPTGITAGTTYYVLSAGLTANAFEIAASPGGAAINTSGTPSGTATAVGGNTVLIQNTLQGTLQAVLTFLGQSLDAQINLCTYTVQSDGLTLGIVYKTTSLLGNNFEIAATTSGCVLSGATLYGGGGLITLTPGKITDLVNLTGTYVYDCRMEFGSPVSTIVYLFGGTLTLNEAVTR